MSFTADINEIVEEDRNGLLGKQSHWKRVRLSEVATILNGAPFDSGHFKKDRGTPLIRIRDVVRGRTETYYDGKYDATYLVQHGELLVGMDGDFNCELWAGEPALLNQRVCKITPDESRYSKQFLRYVLPGYLAAINERTPSITVKHLSSRTVADIPLPLPSADEQHEIVAKLDQQFTCLDAGVAALRRVQANLKRYRAAILKAACEGRLVPTEAELAKAEGRTYETGEQLLARILADRRKSWHGRGKYKEPAAPDTTNLPPLPDGWAWTNIGQLAEVGTGATPARGNPKFYASGTIPWVTSGAVNSPLIERADQFVTANALEKCNLTVYPPGTLLLAMYGEGKTRGMASELMFSATTNQALAAIEIPEMLRSFVKVVLWKNYDDVRKSASGGVQPNLNLSIVRAIHVALSPLAEQVRIVAEVERRLSVIEELEAAVTANLQRSARLRQAILARAFSSEKITQEHENSNGDALDLKAERRKRHFTRALLSAEIVHRLHDEPTFGRVKHQKIFHLCEHIARIDEIQGQYHREAAGPLDNKLIYANEAELKKQKWYEEVPRTKYGHAYRPLAKAGSHRKYLEKYWSDKLPVVEKLIEVMRRWDTDQCEMFSTVYAAWNDLLIEGKTPSGAEILHEVLECWHESKRRFPRERWRKVIEWIEKNGYTPTGFGNVTVSAK